MAEMLGCTTEEMVGKSLFEFMDQAHWAVAKQNLERCRQGRGEPHDFRFRREDGTDLWAIVSTSPMFDEKGQYIGGLGMLTDVTQRRHVEEALRQLNEELESKVQERTATLNATVEELQREVSLRQRVEDSLRESQQFIQRISDATPYFLWVYDLNEEHFVHMNKSMTQFLGIPPDAGFPLAGRIADQVIHPDDSPVHAVYRERSRKAKDGEILDRELRVKNPAGEWRWFLLRSVVLNRNSDGSARQLLGTAIDVTERKEIESRLHQQSAELAHFARLSTVGEMASGLAHELNQPLIAISLQSEVCASLLERMGEGGDLEEVRDGFLRITEQAQRAADVVKFVRSFVRDQPPRRSTYDVHDVIRGVIHVFDADARRAGIDVRYRPTANLPYVLIDRVQIEQVIINLLRNAIEAMEETEPSDRFVVIAAGLASDHSVQISVSDRGEGIAESDLDRVFDSFVTTKSGGMGLGLSICRTIAEAHEGKAWATTNPNRGVTIRFTIPCARDLGGQIE